MEKLTVLIAEDDHVLRALYGKKFSIAGFETWTVADGEDALRLLKEKTPDLFICDIKMWKIDGFGVLERLPKDERTFPVILLTNFDRPELRKCAEELGADGYFVKKDITMKSLVDLAKKLIREKGKNNGHT